MSSASRIHSLPWRSAALFSYRRCRLSSLPGARRGYLAQVTCHDVVEHEVQAEPAVGFEGVCGSLGSPGELLAEGISGGQPRLVIVGPQVDPVQRQVVRPGQMP